MASLGSGQAGNLKNLSFPICIMELVGDRSLELQLSLREERSSNTKSRACLQAREGWAAWRGLVRETTAEPSLGPRMSHGATAPGKQ